MMIINEIIRKSLVILISAILGNSNAVTNISTISATQIQPKDKIICVQNLKSSTISVSCVKIWWDSDSDRNYEICCEPTIPDTGYVDNIYFEFKSNSLCYITGLRENSAYSITVTPETKENEKSDVRSSNVVQRTEAVEVIQEFPYEDGWTNCFAYENAKGLTLNPSWSAIQNCSADKVTNTGIMRDNYGDYCCAMGEWYGEVGDRFLIELENGVQFTTKICDSKGWADDADGDDVPDGRFHWFGGEGNGKCIIEFIYDETQFPSCVAFSGNYGNYTWSGLNFDNIKSIKKINYNEPINY